MARQPRQRPVSCTFCRTRKLRCNRQYPCSNCTSRGVICELGQGAAPPIAAPAEGLGGDAVLKLLSRLDKLEQTVKYQNEELTKTRNAVFGTAPGEGASPVLVSPIRSSTVMASTVSRGIAEPPVSVHIQRFTTDALWLESGCTSEPLTDQFLADEVEFRTCPIRQIDSQGLFTIQTTHPSRNGLYPAVKCIWLPLREEARYLTQRYFLEVTYFHHIVHMPTLRAKVEKLYDDLDAGGAVDKGVVLLLTALLANVCYTWTPEEDARCGFVNAAVANAQARFWVRAGMDLTDHIQRLAHSSMESVQGVTILFFMIFMIEGVSRRGGDILARAITMARDHGLHTIDLARANGTLSHVKEMSPSAKEIGRRIMWYLAATDWTLGSLSLPQEGSHLVDPRGLHVCKPANADDEDIVDDCEIVSHPDDHETSASYFIQRTRLAELIRDLDLMQASVSSDKNDKEKYDGILEVDSRLHRFLSELPPFFSLQFAREASRDFAGAVLRRCTIHLLVRRYLCKIHLPYLARGAVDPMYSYSRRVCLESARTMIRSEAQLSKETLSSMCLRTRMTMVLRCVFLASIALVVDACGPEGAQDVQGDRPQAEEILEAWATLEQAKKISRTAGRLLELSKMVLRKQNPTHPALVTLEKEAEREVLQRRRGGLPDTPDSGLVVPMQEMPGFMGQVQTEEPGLNDEQWLGLEGSMDVDSIDWERFFWGVDAAPFM